MDLDRLCLLCQGWAVNENNESRDWASQMEYVNDTIMASCTFAVMGACHNQSGAQDMPYHVCENGSVPIARDLGWNSSDDFNYTALIRCASPSAPLPHTVH